MSEALFSEGMGEGSESHIIDVELKDDEILGSLLAMDSQTDDYEVRSDAITLTELYLVADDKISQRLDQIDADYSEDAA